MRCKPSFLCGALLAAAALAAGWVDAAQARDKQIVIGLSQRRVAGSDWWKTLIAGITTEGQRLGVKVLVSDAGGDTVRQNADVQTFITRDVDGVIMNANDPRGVSSSVMALKRAGIPLVEVNSNLDPSLAPDTYCYVAEDQVATGAKAGKIIAQEVAERFKPSETIKLAIIGGYPGDVISDLRKQGFLEGYNGYFAHHSGPKTVVLPMRYGHWLPDQALGPMRDIATANPDLRVVFSESDVMQAGIEQGLKQAGIWNHILEGSYDGQMSTVKEMLDDPNGPIRADASNQPWDQGVEAMKMIVAAVKKEPQASVCPGGTHYIDTVVVTPQNAKQYYHADETYIRAGS